jgi:DNA polymerase elongation subunit (family B)
MIPVQFQIVDIISCIDNQHSEDLERLSHEEETDPSINLYCDRNQRALSYKNNQLIKVFGRTEDDQSILANVSGFLPFFYLGFEEDVSQSEASYIVSALKRKAKKSYQNHLVDWELIYRQPYERFVGHQKFPFLKLYFRNKYSFKEFEMLAQRERSIRVNRRVIGYYVGESNLDEILKFVHQTDIRPTSWVEIEKYRPKISKSAYVSLEIDCDISGLKPMDRITNSPFKMMIYDIECQSQLGELGDFPVAKKNYQKLARELIDLWSSNQKHELVRNELTVHRVLETCLRLVFTPYYYPFGIRQVKTIDNLKPRPELVREATELVVYLSQQCRSTTFCEECGEQLSSLLEKSFPAPVDPLAYYHLARQIWINIGNMTRFNYNKEYSWEEIEGYVTVMFQLAFEDFYDGFSFSPIVLKGRAKPQPCQLNNLTPVIHQLITSKSDYETKLRELTEFLTKQLSPILPKGDPAIQIGFTFQRLGAEHPYIKGIYTVDSCLPFTNGDLVRDENDTELSQQEVEKMTTEIRKRDGVAIETRDQLVDFLSQQQEKTDRSQVVIRSFSTESAMIKEFGRLINQEDPDMIGGYNNFGFDDQYLFHRAEELAIKETFLTRLPRLKHDIASIRQPAGAERDKKDEQKGKRKMETHYLSMSGRIVFDIYRIIPNNYNLPEYKLNFVCKYFLKKQKNDVPPTQIPILQRGSDADRSLVARYCIIDCVLCNRLLAKLSIVNNLIAMSNVSLVPIRYLLFRGQTIKGFSLIVKKCSERGKVVRTLRREERPINADKYEGAIVLDPEINIYDTPISVADFNSLYPSSMISENISNDTLVTGPEYDNLPGFHYNTVKYDEFVFQQARHKKTGAVLKRMEKIKKPDMRVCRFVGNMKGILPEIEEELIASRKAAKRKMAEYEGKDPAMAAAWDCQQLAYKITCNSIYGITGASVSPIYNKDIAASITATGRKMIIFSKNYVEQTYRDLLVHLTNAKICCRDVLVKRATCVYGDTDSIFIKFDMFDHSNGKVLEGMDAVFASMEICAKAAREISLQLKSPQNLEFEKTICPFLLINKKMYKGHYYEKMNKQIYSEKTMGFATKKRDSAPIAKKVVDGLTDLLFSIDSKKLDQQTIRQYITDKFKRILGGEYPLEDFIRTKSWKGHYANPDQIAQHVLAVRQAIRDPGNQFQVNDRIPFIHIVNPKSALQGDRIETVEFVKSNNLAIDYHYYIEKQLINPLLKILSPNHRLGITEKWLLGILKNLCQEQNHVITMDKVFQIIPKRDQVPQSPINQDSSSDSDSE